MKNLAIFCMSILVIFLLNACKEQDVDLGIKITNPEFNPDKTYSTMTDQDGNVYKTITIGTQTWMAENLRTTTYRDGTSIPELVGANEWDEATAGAFCTYNSTILIDSITTYGRLYNWYAISDQRNIAPAGWHVPTLFEWVQLYDYLEGNVVAGGKLKETGNAHWLNPNMGANNESGFTALPGGMRADPFDESEKTFFGGIGESGYWWSATEENGLSAYSQQLFYGVSEGSVYDGKTKGSGLSVRCVKD